MHCAPSKIEPFCFQSLSSRTSDLSVKHIAGISVPQLAAKWSEAEARIFGVFGFGGACSSCYNAILGGCNNLGKSSLGLWPAPFLLLRLLLTPARAAQEQNASDASSHQKPNARFPRQRSSPSAPWRQAALAAQSHPSWICVLCAWG